MSRENPKRLLSYVFGTIRSDFVPMASFSAAENFEGFCN